jgi:hypothetical protein
MIEDISSITITHVCNNISENDMNNIQKQALPYIVLVMALCILLGILISAVVKGF